MNKDLIKKTRKINLPVQKKQIEKITTWGIVTNIFLGLIKIISGFFVHSVALIADGVHSFSDLFTDLVVIITNKAAKKPPDLSHPYGHGRFATFGAILIAIALIIVGMCIGWSAILSLYKHKQIFPGTSVIYIAGISVIIKEILFRITRNVAAKVNSTLLYANAWHHRSDALSSFAVVFGSGANLLGFGYGDQIAGLIVGLMVMAVAGKIIFEALKELSEHSLDQKIVNIIKQTLEHQKDVHKWHKLRTRKIGDELFVDVHILVDPELTVQKSHKFTEEIELKIEERIERPINMLIHVEPYYSV